MSVNNFKSLKSLNPRPPPFEAQRQVFSYSPETQGVKRENSTHYKFDNVLSWKLSLKFFTRQPFGETVTKKTKKQETFAKQDRAPHSIMQISPQGIVLHGSWSRGSVQNLPP